MKVSEIFNDEPSQWGLRGDPYLWRGMKELLKDTDMPCSIEELQILIEETYKKATGHPLTYQGHFLLDRFQHGGMSSGFISPEFWTAKGIPILVERHVKMKILSWNLNHRILLKRIPDAVISVITDISPDLVVLNEFVDGEERDSFKQSLEKSGYTYISVSKKMNRQNQVLIASKSEHEVGDLIPPSCSESSKTNFLHIIMPLLDIEIVGLRVPFYKKAQELKLYWSQLLEIIRSTVSRNIVFIGDFNCNPVVPKTPGGKALNLLQKEGWQIPQPSGGWSYISHNGENVSCLDHALGSPILAKISATYTCRHGCHIIAGPKDLNPISDHALLIAQISSNQSIKRDV